ncbi:leucine-rich repeat-containing protein 74A [Patella vulgata]|uniref:leucine-rich repeat-containing protein 74A n=1 Tax=Patella vulgata TaxID=6465 RepID=UPI00217FEF11|nr:leucine-rich repeat-containing protein 74A [Patella vulgata]
MNSKIEKLDLEGNDIEEDGCVCLSDMLRENIYITKLVLSNNRIGNDGVITLCDILKRNDAVTTLDISGNELSDVSAVQICEMLQKNATIKHLLLSHNQFEEKAAECFNEALSVNEALESLDLSWNRFRTRGAVCIAEGVQENYGLRCLNLCMNGFGLDGACSMGKALKVNRTLQELDMCFNRIPDKGVEEIAIGLQTNDVLKSLKIGSNQFGGDSALFLLKSIDKNDSSALNYLELLNVEVTEEFMDLKKILETERQMKIFHGGLVCDDTYNIPTSWRLDDVVDSWMSKNPMSILKKYIVESGYRLIDLFKDFDKDGNMFITRDEFTKGLQAANINMTETQIQELVQQLDKDKNGKIDFAELIEGDKEYREMQRKILKQKLEEQK